MGCSLLYAPVFQAVEYSRPEFSALIFTNPHAQDIFPSVQVDSNRDIHCFLHDLPFAADMVVDGIQKYHSVNGFQGALLPFTNHRQDLVRDPADRAVRDGNAVNLLNVCFNVPCRHPLGVHGQDFLFNVLANAGLVFLQYLRLKFTLAVSGNRHLHVAETGTQSLAAVPVAAVICVLVLVVVFAVAQLVIQLRLQAGFQELGNGFLKQVLDVIHAVDVCHLQQLTDFFSTCIFFRGTVLSGHM